MGILDSLTDTGPRSLSHNPYLSDITRGHGRKRPDAGETEDWRDDFDECTLIRWPITEFSGDVMEPGVRFEGDESLVKKAEDIAPTAAIIGGEVEKDLTRLMELQVDEMCVTGEGVVEVVYEDRAAQNKVLAFTLVKSETLTAYHKPGKALLLEPEEDVSKIVRGKTVRDSVPTTPAGETPAWVQFDNVFSDHDDKEEVAFSQNDVVRIAYRPEAGGIRGKSMIEPVHDRVESLLQKLNDVDEAIRAKAYAFWLFKLGSEDNPAPKSKVRQFIKEHSSEDWEPGKKQAVTGNVDVETISGEVPEVWQSFEFDVKYILSGMPFPFYRSPYGSEINRDVAIRVQEDYADLVSKTRRNLEEAWTPAIREAVGAGEDADLQVVIEPKEDRSPLSNPNFDAGEFKATMDALKAAAPGGAVEQVLKPEAIVEVFLKLDPDDVMPDEGELQDINEANAQVQKAMEMAKGEGDPGANEPETADAEKDEEQNVDPKTGE